MKKQITPKKVRQGSAFSNPVQEAAQGNSQIANPVNRGFRAEAPELKARREVPRNQG